MVKERGPGQGRQDSHESAGSSKVELEMRLRPLAGMSGSGGSRTFLIQLHLHQCFYRRNLRRNGFQEKSAFVQCE